MNALADWLLEQYPCKELTNENGEPIERWITCPARLQFPNLEKASKLEGSAGEEKFSCALLFPVNADLSLLKTVASAAARAKFGPGVKPGALRNPFRAQGEKDFSGFENGATYINVTSKFKPVIIDENKKPLAATDPRIYPGVWVRAKVTCYAYDAPGNKGVAFGIVSLQRLADDDAFATGGEVADAGIDDAKPVPASLRKTGATANGAANGAAAGNDW